jgi:hypothetical protein
MALKGSIFVRPKNVGKLRPQKAGLSGGGWDLAGLAMQAGATGELGATGILPVVAGWLRRAATGDPIELLCIDGQWLVATLYVGGRVMLL